MFPVSPVSNHNLLLDAVPGIFWHAPGCYSWIWPWPVFGAWSRDTLVPVPGLFLMFVFLVQVLACSWTPSSSPVTTILSHALCLFLSYHHCCIQQPTGDYSRYRDQRISCSKVYTSLQGLRVKTRGSPRFLTPVLPVQKPVAA